MIDRGYHFNIPNYDSWLNQKTTDDFFRTKGWKTYQVRKYNYNWFDQDDEYDSYFASGYFSRIKTESTELVQLGISTKKTVVPVFGLDIPAISEKLNKIAQKVGKVDRIYTPFATLYHDMKWSTWTGDVHDVHEVFLGYASDKQMSQSIKKIQEYLDDTIEAFFQRGVTKELIELFIGNNFFEFKNGGPIGTLENEELVFWYYILAEEHALDYQFVLKDIEAKLGNKFSVMHRTKLLDLNESVYNYFLEANRGHGL